MNKKEVLQKIDLGNSIAEYDENISQYYITTQSTLDLINDRYDIIKGVKGSGKTAMLIAICDNQSLYPQLENKLLIKAIQLKGDPDFKRAFSTVSIKTSDIQKLIDAWKIYLINVIWKECKELFSNYENLESQLKKAGLLSGKKGILDNLIYSLKRVKFSFTNTFSPDGKTIQTVEVTPSDFNESQTPNDNANTLVDFNSIFSSLNELIINNSSCFWVMIDRLDDAFPDNTSTDTLILKSLFYAYKDICGYSGFKIKIFIRDDIFKTITLDKGFTSLTHISAKTMNSIKWERDIIEQLLVERLLYNASFANYVKTQGYPTTCKKLTPSERLKILFLFIKPQIDVGSKNPDSIGWMINHVKDGNGIYTPRDIINILDKARAFQLNQLNEKNEKDISESYLISSNALRLAFAETSKEKLETQLFAEYPKCRKWIESFKDQKAEHTAESLARILGRNWKSRTEKLKEIGFLEEKNNSWKIPFIYREGLNVSQGKAK